MLTDQKQLIPLSQGEFAVVDKKQLQRCNQFNWWLCGGYAQGRVFGQRMYLHHFIFGSSIQLDHRNGNKLDCRKRNLRPATSAQNSQNTKHHQDCVTNYKGVAWFSRDNKWRAQIHVDGKYKHLGYFEDEIETAKAYDKAARKAFGRFAKTNF